MTWHDNSIILTEVHTNAIIIRATNKQRDNTTIVKERAKDRIYPSLISLIFDKKKWPCLSALYRCMSANRMSYHVHRLKSSVGACLFLVQWRSLPSSTTTRGRETPTDTACDADERGIENPTDTDRHRVRDNDANLWQRQSINVQYIYSTNTWSKKSTSLPKRRLILFLLLPFFLFLSTGDPLTVWTFR